MIRKFEGEYRWLSNFWPSTVLYARFGFPAVENAYQAAKCLFKEDMIQFQTCTAGAARKLGMRVDMRPSWEEVKVSVMKDLLKQKFQHSDLKAKLIETGVQELVEGNWWGDRFWGVCEGNGQNMLGKLIMDIRNELQMEVNACR